MHNRNDVRTRRATMATPARRGHAMRRVTAPVMVAAGTALLALGAPPAQAQRDTQDWTWSGTVQDGRWVYVRNLNGPIRVESGTGSQVEVRAVKRAHRRGRVEDVTITVTQRASGGDVVVCALWSDRTRCDEDGYSTRSDRSWWDWRDDDRNDVSVEFTVRLPKGVRVAASTVNGGLDIDGVDSEVEARAVNGSITARSNGGPVSARTTNGSLTIRTGRIGSEHLEYSTVNGQITLEMPPGTNADVELRTVNGSISTDFPLTIEGRFNNRSVRGRVGNGGPLVQLSTVNGSIMLRKG
jgi:hypothetical protein